MNKTQIMNIITPLIATLAGVLATRFPLLDQATWNMLITAVALASVTAVLTFVNRGQALKDTVGHLPLTTVVTDKASADALPKNPDVIAATPEIVKAVNEAKARNS